MRPVPDIPLHSRDAVDRAQEIVAADPASSPR
jgi:hypothetical protein